MSERIQKDFQPKPYLRCYKINSREKRVFFKVFKNVLKDFVNWITPISTLEVFRFLIG